MIDLISQGRYGSDLAKARCGGGDEGVPEWYRRSSLPEGVIPHTVVNREELEQQARDASLRPFTSPAATSAPPSSAPSAPAAPSAPVHRGVYTPPVLSPEERADRLAAHFGA